MTDFESNIRSIERAVSYVKTPLVARAFLDRDGVKIVIHDINFDNKQISRIIAWHEIAMWRAPQGGGIVQRMVRDLTQAARVFP